MTRRYAASSRLSTNSELARLPRRGLRSTWESSNAIRTPSSESTWRARSVSPLPVKRRKVGVDVQTSANAPARAGVTAWALPALVLLGFFLRVIFVGNQGFKTDVSTYVAWAIALSQHGLAGFYSRVGFADYPPGYFYVLAVVGHLWRALFPNADLAALRMLVKLPAILADLGVGLLLYALVRRFAGVGSALAAAALYLLNPAIIYISARGVRSTRSRADWRSWLSTRYCAPLRLRPRRARPSTKPRLDGSFSRGSRLDARC